MPPAIDVRHVPGRGAALQRAPAGVRDLHHADGVHVQRVLQVPGFSGLIAGGGGNGGSHTRAHTRQIRSTPSLAHALPPKPCRAKRRKALLPRRLQQNLSRGGVRAAPGHAAGGGGGDEARGEGRGRGAQAAAGPARGEQQGPRRRRGASPARSPPRPPAPGEDAETSKASRRPGEARGPRPPPRGRMPATSAAAASRARSGRVACTQSGRAAPVGGGRGEVLAIFFRSALRPMSH